MDIARVGPERIREEVTSLDEPSVDAIAQVGTNLSFVARADALESEPGKPSSPSAPPSCGTRCASTALDNRVTGAGSLLSDH
ncbi:hypothetical protein [Streptomyces sp. NPDC059371]|uniref:hypothetical protein n=1 Tax=Streptomyces sp. NPDC059371 TaxID=3346812 RepID=UPI003689D9C9